MKIIILEKKLSMHRQQKILAHIDELLGTLYE
jgi:hypothetical protein